MSVSWSKQDVEGSRVIRPLHGQKAQGGEKPPQVLALGGAEMPFYTFETFEQPHELYSWIKRGLPLHIFHTERGREVPQNGVIAIEGPRYNKINPWQVLVELKNGHAVRLIDKVKTKTGRIKKVKYVPPVQREPVVRIRDPKCDPMALTDDGQPLYVVEREEDKIICIDSR